MIFSSKLIEDAVAAFNTLPGIGKKTALRMVLHLLKQEDEKVKHFTTAIQKMCEEVKYCKHCYYIADTESCEFCRDSHRNAHQICVVENIRDVISIESTRQYNGLYHVLGGLLSPLDGVGPEQLFIEALKNRVANLEQVEVIMALSPTIEGDTTVYYISKQLASSNARITSIARGVAFGGELEYTDEITLGRSILKRLPIDNYVNIVAQK